MHDLMIPFQKQHYYTELLAEHYNQASSYIDRLQAHLGYGTARKILAITERLWEI